MIVKCQECGSEYIMPDILEVAPIMKDCPACKEAKRMVDEFLKKSGLGENSE